MSGRDWKFSLMSRATKLQLWINVPRYVHISSGLDLFCFPQQNSNLALNIQNLIFKCFQIISYFQLYPEGQNIYEPVTDKSHQFQVCSELKKGSISPLDCTRLRPIYSLGKRYHLLVYLGFRDFSTVSNKGRTCTCLAISTAHVSVLQ